MAHLPSAFGVPVIDALGERLALVLHGEIDDRGRPAECGGAGAGEEIVAGLRTAERQLHVGVRIDAARDDELSGGVDNAVGFYVERLTDGRNGLAVDEKCRRCSRQRR
jgi:hypothetical protein